MKINKNGTYSLRNLNKEQKSNYEGCFVKCSSKLYPNELGLYYTWNNNIDRTIVDEYIGVDNNGKFFVHGD